MISQLSHITLIVENLEKTSRLFEGLFRGREIYSSGENTFSLSREKFFLIGDLWFCIMEGESSSGRTYNHIAFKIEEDDYEIWLERIRGWGLEIRPERTRVPGEGRSIYFYDYDNHLFELHTGTLEERLTRYRQMSADRS